MGEKKEEGKKRQKVNLEMPVSVNQAWCVDNAAKVFKWMRGAGAK